MNAYKIPGSYKTCRVPQRGYSRELFRRSAETRSNFKEYSTPFYLRTPRNNGRKTLRGWHSHDAWTFHFRARCGTVNCLSSVIQEARISVKGQGQELAYVPFVQSAGRRASRNQNTNHCQRLVPIEIGLASEISIQPGTIIAAVTHLPFSTCGNCSGKTKMYAVLLEIFSVKYSVF